MVKRTDNKPNKLINEKSPYLLQHAYNPVDWYPWGDAAFRKAQAEDKPIFLSIGYSTCHWCHVMERESFGDEEVAELLNEHFVAVKVDREERPDVDSIYMSVCQALNGHGGWPLTVVMTPDRKPFFAGTYYPKHSRQGLPGLLDVLTKLNHAWQQQRLELEQSSHDIVRAVSDHFFKNRAGDLDQEVLHDAFLDYHRSFDARYGGFNQAPKFPTPHNLAFLLRYWYVTGKEEALAMVEKTLHAMYQGGMYDHIGFGFARYSTDRYWFIPHFEKMLYDNALLAMVYTEAYQATGNPLYAEVVDQILTYVGRDMTDERGGFFSAEDADSEGEEGKFYVWQRDEVLKVLGQEEGAKFCDVYDITGAGNFEGANIPNLLGGLPEDSGWVAECRDKLFKYREERIHPHKDDKVLTAWNGLMVAAMAMAGKVMPNDEYIQAAKRAVYFIEHNLVDERGRLLARYRDGEAAYLAYLEDYSYLVWGLIELYEATFEPEYLEKAMHWNRQMLYWFLDEEEGGFFLYGKDGENLIGRPKEVYDGALPSGNSAATLNMLRLAELVGDTDLGELAEQQLRTFGGNVKEHPTAHSHMLMALLFNLHSKRQIVICGRRQEVETETMLARVRQDFLPLTVTLFKAADEEGQQLEAIVDFVKGHQTVDDRATAYVCRSFACQTPVTGIKEFERLLPHA